MPTGPFKLTDAFTKKYSRKKPEFGPLGEFVFKRTYSRKSKGRMESFQQTIQRVVEGTYNIQKNHCKSFNLPWNEMKAQYSAKIMFEKMWAFKF